MLSYAVILNYNHLERWQDHRMINWRLIRRPFRVYHVKKDLWGFPRGSVIKNSPDNAGDMSSIPGPGDPTCLRAAKPVHRNYWACMCSRAGELPLRSPDASATEVCTPQSPCSAPREATTTRSPHTTIRDWPCSRQLERSVPSSEDSAQPK